MDLERSGSMNNKGFTMLELIATVAVLFIVAGIAAPSMISLLDHQSAEADEILAYQLNDATESYALVTGSSLDFNATDFVFSDCEVSGALSTDLMVAKLMENGYLMAKPDPNQSNVEFQWNKGSQEWRVVEIS